MFFSRNWTYIATCTAQKKFSIKDFFSKCDQIRRKLRIWSYLLKKSLMENFFCYAVIMFSISFVQYSHEYHEDFLRSYTGVGICENSIYEYICLMYQYQNISCTVLRSKIQLKTSSFRRVAASIKVLCSGFFTNTMLLDALILVLFLSTKNMSAFAQVLWMMVFLLVSLTI